MLHIFNKLEGSSYYFKIFFLNPLLFFEVYFRPKIKEVNRKGSLVVEQNETNLDLDRI